MSVRALSGLEGNVWGRAAKQNRSNVMQGCIMCEMVYSIHCHFCSELLQGSFASECEMHEFKTSNVHRCTQLAQTEIRSDSFLWPNIQIAFVYVFRGQR